MQLGPTPDCVLGEIIGTMFPQGKSKSPLLPVASTIEGLVVEHPKVCSSNHACEPTRQTPDQTESRTQQQPIPARQHRLPDFQSVRLQLLRSVPGSA